MKYYYKFNINDYSFVALLDENKNLIYLNMNHDEDNFEHLTLVDVDLKVKEELELYFLGKLKDFSFPYVLKGTSFQLRVWEELKKVPYGTKISYSDLAIMVGDVNKTRAVATAVGNNPIVIAIPCHRITRKDGTIGQYSAGGPKVKKRLLDIEKAS